MKIKILYLLFAIFLMTIIVTSCEVIKVGMGNFSIGYPKDGAEDVPLQLTVKINDPTFNKAITYDVYLNGELIKAGVNSTEIKLRKKLEPGTEYVMEVEKRALGEENIGEEVVRFETTRRPVFIYMKPLGDIRYYEGMELEWQAVDPDGDELRYDVYVGEKGGELTLVASDLKDDRYKLKGLVVGKEYEWKVVAKDDKGAESGSEIGGFTYAAVPYQTIVYGVGSGGLWEFKVSNDGAIVPEKIGYLEGMKERHIYNGIVYTEGYLYINDRQDNSLLIYQKTDGNEFYYKSTVNIPHGCVDRLKYEKGLIIGYGDCDYYIYDPRKSKILLSENVSRGCCGKSYIGVTDKYILVLLTSGNIWDYGDTYYKFTVYDKSSLAIIASKEDSGYDYIVRGLAFYNNKLYVAVVMNGLYLYVYDATNFNDIDYNNPEKTIYLSDARSWDVEIEVIDEKIYVVDRENKKQVYVIDPETLKVLLSSSDDLDVISIYKVNSLDKFIALLGYKGTKGIGMLDNDLNLVDSYDRGFLVADRVFAVKNYVYVLDCDAEINKRIAIYDENMHFKGYVSDPLYWIERAEVYKNYWIVAGDDQIRIYDVSDPSNPVKIWETSVDGIKGLSISGKYVYALSSNDSNSTLYIYEILDRGALNFKIGYPLNMSNLGRIETGNDVLVVGGWEKGYEMLDVSDPINPQIIVRKTKEENGIYVGTESAIIGNYAYIFVEKNNDGTQQYIEVYDISDPTNPILKSEVKISICYSCGGARSYNNYIVTSACDEVTIIDVSNPEVPKEVEKYVGDTSLNPLSRCNHSNLDINEKGDLILSNGGNGVVIYNVEDLAAGNVNLKGKIEWFSIYDVAVGE